MKLKDSCNLFLGKYTNDVKVIEAPEHWKVYRCSPNNISLVRSPKKATKVKSVTRYPRLHGYKGNFFGSPYKIEATFPRSKKKLESAYRGMGYKFGTQRELVEEMDCRARAMNQVIGKDKQPEFGIYSLYRESVKKCQRL